MLAVSVTFSPQGVVSFLGDAQPDTVEISIQGGLLRYTGATPSAETLNIPVNQITSLSIDLGGGEDDRVMFDGGAPLTFNNASLAITNTEWVGIDQSLTTGGDQTYTGNVYIRGEVTLTSVGTISFDPGSKLNAAPTFAGRHLLAWQRNLGTPAATPFADGDWDGDGEVDQADLSIWKEYFGVGGTNALTLVADGQVQLLGAVGDVRPLNSLDVSADGGIVLGDGPFNLEGNSTTFNSPVILTADTVINDTGDVTFNSTVDSDGLGNWDLTVNTPTNTIFNGVVGGNFPLGDLVTDAPGETRLNANINTAGDQTYNDGVKLIAASVTLMGNDVRFFGTVGSMVDGFSALVVNTLSSGETLFAQAVGGGGMRLASLTTNPDGTTVLGSAGPMTVTTTGDQTYEDAVKLVPASVTLAGNDVRFEGTLGSMVDGFSALAVITSGNGVTEFAMPVGGPLVGSTMRLASLTTNPDGTTVLGSAGLMTVNTTGDQFYGDDVTLAANATLAGDDVTFDQTLSGPFNLNVTTTPAGVTQFNGAVSLNNLTTDANGSTVINTGTITTTQDQFYGDNVTLLVDAALSGDDVTFDMMLTGAADLIVDTTTAAGVTRFNGVVSLDNLTTDEDGSTEINTPAVNTTQDQTYGDPVKLIAPLVTLTGNDVRFEGTLGSMVDGFSALAVITSGNGVTEFAMPVGGPLVGSTMRLSSLTTNPDGMTVLGSSAGPMTVNTTGDQTYNDPVKLVSATVTLMGNDVRFFGTVGSMVDGFSALTVNTQGNGQTLFAQAVGGGGMRLAGLTTNPDGTTVLGSAGPMTVTTTGNQFYGDDVTLAANATLTGDNITFDQTLSGPFNLLVDTVLVTTGITRFNDVVTLNNLTTDVDGMTEINTASITTTQDQTYNDPVKLIPATVTLTGDDVRFLGTLNSMVDGFSALTVNASGDTQFGGSVGMAGMRLKSITTNPPGQTQFGSAAGPVTITTTEDQLYGDPVVLLNHASLAGRDITFMGTVNSGAGGPWDLTVDAARFATFNMAVGGLSKLQNLSVFTGSAGPPPIGAPGPFAGTFTLNVAVTVLDDISIQVRESAVGSAADDIVLQPGAQLSAGMGGMGTGNVTLLAGDDITIESLATITASGMLTIQSDVGDNDAFGTMITTTTATPLLTDAVGALSATAGISISGGSQVDAINLQAERLLTPATATVSGLGGSDEILLVFAPNSNLTVGQMVINGGNAADTDRLTIDHISDTNNRLVTATYTTQYMGGPDTTIDGSNADFAGYGTTSGFSILDMEKYFLQAGSGVNDHINILAADQTFNSNLEQQIFVSSDSSRQWQLTGWESGHLAGSNVRDAILNNTSISMLLEGRAGNDTIVGGNDPNSMDVIFGGGGAPFSRVGQPDSLLSDLTLFPVSPSFPINSPERLVRMGDYLVGRRGNDFLFSDVDLFRNGPDLVGVVTLDAAGESDVIDGGAPDVPLGPEMNHAAQIGVNDIVRRITGMLVEGGATKDVNTWLRATPMTATLNPDLTSPEIDMLIDAAFFSAPGKVGILTATGASLDFFRIRPLPPPAVAALTAEMPADAPATGAPGPSAAVSVTGGSSVGVPGSWSQRELQNALATADEDEFAWSSDVDDVFGDWV